MNIFKYTYRFFSSGWIKFNNFLVKTFFAPKVESNYRSFNSPPEVIINELERDHLTNLSKKSSYVSFDKELNRKTDYSSDSQKFFIPFSKSALLSCVYTFFSSTPDTAAPAAVNREAQNNNPKLRKK